MDLDIIKNGFKKSIIAYDRDKAFSLFDKYTHKYEPLMFINNIMVDVLEEIGKLWEDGNVSLSQIYLSSKICEDIVGKSFTKHREIIKESPKMAIVTLQDHHILGKKIVSSVIRASGYKIHDFGYGMDADTLIEKVINEQISILLISVLMYPSALKVKKVRDGLDNHDKEVRIVVGGAPFLFDRELWKKVGADAMASNAYEDVQIIEKWIQEV